MLFKRIRVNNARPGGSPLIIKRYIRHLGGSDSGYWDNIWVERIPRSIDELAERVDPVLVRTMRRYLKPGARVLEGGCGSGNYVAWFHKQGCSVTGLDFASQTVRRLNEVFPWLDVREGNVRSLPFDNDTFDAYYSGGVIEHFEDGLEPQLKEAYRILTRGGVFLCTVPYVNITRNWSNYVLGDREKVDLDGQATLIRIVHELREEKSPAQGFAFHEYVFESDFMVKKLEETGFRVVETNPFSARWGLLDVSSYRRLAGIGRVRRHIGHKVVALPLRAIGLIEKSDGAAARVLQYALGKMLGNLCLYVARKP